MKSKPFVLFIFALVLSLFAVSLVTAQGPAAPEGVDMFSVAPLDAVPGAPVTVSFDLELNAGANGSTSLCLYVPVDNGTPLIDAPATFDVTYGFGSTATFVNSGACFGSSAQASAFYTATGLPNAGMVYSGSFATTLDDGIDDGDYTWIITVFEPFGGSRSTAEQQQGVNAPTAITIGNIGHSGSSSLPVILGFVMVAMSASTLFLLKRRFDQS